jgi:myo-inositol-1(or 4)-monophosphatase
MNNMKNKSQFLKVAVAAAYVAGAIQKKGFGKRHQVRFKGEIDLVTEVDKGCEDKIHKIISREFPEHDFLMEESGSSNKPSEFKWIIDPLDGTTNYAHGYPCFCVSIGLEYRGKVIVGVVYEPIMDQLFTAVRGEGAFRNRKKIKVSKTPILKRGMLVTGFSYDLQKRTKDNIENFSKFIMNAQAVRRDGAAAIDLCYVACGRFDGFWELDLQPWDTAAGSLVLQEAGGKLSRFDGTVFSIYDRDILASNGIIHPEMIDILKGA